MELWVCVKLLGSPDASADMRNTWSDKQTDSWTDSIGTGLKVAGQTDGRIDGLRLDWRTYRWTKKKWSRPGWMDGLIYKFSLIIIRSCIKTMCISQNTVLKEQPKLHAGLKLCVSSRAVKSCQQTHPGNHSRQHRLRVHGCVHVGLQSCR